MKKISWLTVFTLLAIFAGVLRIVYLFLIDLLQFPQNYLDYIDYAIVVLVILILILWLQHRKGEKDLRQAKIAELERRRREDFRQAILQLKPETWQGPIQSGYGLHLVYVFSREDSYIPEWQTIKMLLLDDMAREARKAAKELFYTEILRNYEIVYRGEVVDILGEESE